MDYRIIGNVNVSDERRDEFNDYILKLLKIGGIRRIKGISINGKDFKVVEYPKPDENGIVDFNYSIFEREERELSYFDMKNCQLYCTDRGYMQYGVVMNLLMTMQVAYSETPCILMEKDVPLEIYGYAVCIKQLLGLTLDFTDRSNCWENMLLLRKHGYTDIKIVDVWLSISYKFHTRSWEYVVSSLYIIDKIRECEDYPENDFWKIEKESRKWIGGCVLKILRYCIETEGIDSVRERLRELLELPLEERTQLSKGEDKYWSRLAELSLYELPPVFVRALAMITEEEFWDVWESFHISGYMEKICFIEENQNEEENVSRQIFWSAVKENEGMGRLEFLSNSEAARFPEVEERIKSWKEGYEQISDMLAINLNIEAELIDILVLQEKIWGTHYVSKSMIEEFQKNIEDLRYKKAIYLYKQIMDEDIKDFPEMTRSQILNHVIKYTNQKKKRKDLQAYAALLCNVELRRDVLGF